MANYPQLDNASGVWKLREVYDAVMGGYWPNANSRALFMGGNGNITEFITIASTGNASFFGTIGAVTDGTDSSGHGNQTRAIFTGNSPLATQVYYTISTLGNAANFGDLSVGRRLTSGASNETRGLTAGGITPSYVNTIDYNSIMSTGAATDFGDLTVSRYGSNSGTASPTRALFAGGYTGSNSNVIDFVEISTTGNATDFGNLSAAEYGYQGCSSSTRAVFSGGNISSLQFVTIASQGNSIDYGDLSASIRNGGSTSNSVRGVVGGGHASPVNINTIEFFNIPTGGNATDFGDLSEIKQELTATSQSHGGLNDGYQGTRPIPFQENGGDLGLYFGGEPAGGQVQFINISSTGNSNSFSDASITDHDSSGSGNKTRGISYSGSPGAVRYVEFATKGNVADFGDPTRVKTVVGCAANNTRLIAGGGNNSPAGNVNDIDYFTIGTLGNAADFGDLTLARQPLAGTSSNTRAVFGGGNVPAVSNVIDYVTISTVGNAADFGDLTVARKQGGSASSSTRAVFAGGRSTPSPIVDSNVMDYITIATTGNATDFGDLANGRLGTSGVSNTTRGCFMGGLNQPTVYASIDYITISSTGNAQDFGDLSAAARGGASAANGHGGLVGG